MNWKLPRNGGIGKGGRAFPIEANNNQNHFRPQDNLYSSQYHYKDRELGLSYQQSENCGRNHNYEALIAGASRACRIVSCFDLLLFYLRISLFTPMCVCVSTYSRSTVSSGECLRLFYCSISYQRSSKQATQGKQTLRPRTALGLGAVLGSGDIIISLDKLCLCFVLACLAVRVPCSA